MSLPEPAELGLMRSVAISPDGTQLACVGGRFPATRIYHRRVEDLVLFTVFAGDIRSMNDARIASPGDPRTRWTLTTGGMCARFLPTGHVVYSRDGNLRAAAFDLGTRTMSDPVVVVRNVRICPCRRSGGRLRLVALIAERSVIERVLRHLGCPTELPAPRPGRSPPPSSTRAPPPDQRPTRAG